MNRPAHWHLFPLLAISFLSLIVASLPAQQTDDLLATVENRGVPRKLWKFSPEVKKQISARRVSDSADRVTKLCSDLKSNAKKVTRLMSFWQMVYFHDFYQKLYDSDLRAKLGRAMKTIASNKDFFDSSPSMKSLRNQWGTTIDSLGTLDQCPKVAKRILHRYNKNPKLANDPSESRFCYQIVYTMTRQLGMLNTPQKKSSWYKLMSKDLLIELKKIAVRPSRSKHDTPVITNTIFLFSSQIKRISPKLKTFSHQTVSLATKKQPKYSEEWREAMQRIGDFFGGKLANGKKVDTTKLYDDLKKKFFPNTFTFQLGEGKAIIKGSLSKKEAKRLVASMKVVREEFFKHVPHQTPVKDDRNKDFTLVCYPSKSSYKQWHSRFFGLSTDNGGIYMENVGTLYTYQRTARESIYTFEELALHEFVHYLDCRYNIYGGFYSPGSPYVKYNIDWYLEGLAECLVGSVEGRGVLPRKKLVKRIVKNPMTIRQMINSSYKDADPFKFYPHSGVFHCFLLNERPELSKQIFRTIRNNDKKTMTAVFENMKKNQKLQKDYDVYLAQLRKGLKDGSVRFYEDN